MDSEFYSKSYSKDDLENLEVCDQAHKIITQAFRKDDLTV
jgi:hypothetical protein